MLILAKIRDFVKAHRTNIMLFLIVVLLVLFSFASGYIIAKYQQKPKIQFYENT